MRISHFPWAPVLAGFSAGIVGFVVAALAAGVVHIGSSASCRLGGHDGRLAAEQIDATPQPHGRLVNQGCSCCCGNQPALTSTALNDEPNQLTAIVVTGTAPAERWSCEEEPILLTVATALTSTPRLDEATEPIMMSAGGFQDVAPDQVKDSAEDMVVRQTNFLEADRAEERADTSGRSKLTTSPIAAIGASSNSPQNWEGSTATGSSSLVGLAGLSPGAGSASYRALLEAPGTASDMVAALVRTTYPLRSAAGPSLQPSNIVHSDSSVTPGIDLVAPASVIGLTTGFDLPQEAYLPHEPPPLADRSVSSITTAAVPEPASLVLLLVCLILAGTVMWFQRQPVAWIGSTQGLRTPI